MEAQSSQPHGECLGKEADSERASRQETSIEWWLGGRQGPGGGGRSSFKHGGVGLYDRKRSASEGEGGVGELEG